MSEIWRLRTFRFVFVGFLLIQSTRTLISGIAGSHEGPHGPNILIALSLAEIIAATAFLVECIEGYACAGLLLIFAIAAVLAMMADDILPVRFVYYAATVLFIATARPGMTRKT